MSLFTPGTEPAPDTFPGQPSSPYPLLHQPPRKKRSRRRLWLSIIVGLVIIVLVSAVIAGVSGQGKSPSPTSSPTQSVAQHQSSPASQPTQVSQPTQLPTALPSPTQAQPSPTQTPAVVLIGNQVVVGGTETTFTAKFGNPISQTTQNGATVLMYAMHDSNIGQFGVVLFPGTHTVYGMVIAPPTGQTWDAMTAIEVSVAYLPDDVTLNQPQNVTDSSGTVTGLYQSGFSAELANSLSSALFTDASGNNLVKRGTFSVKYTYSDSTGTQANLCSIRLGEQSTTS